MLPESNVALKNTDAKETEKLLKEYLPKNKKFLEMSLKRFSEILSEEDS